MCVVVPTFSKVEPLPSGQIMVTPDGGAKCNISGKPIIEWEGRNGYCEDRCPQGVYLTSEEFEKQILGWAAAIYGDDEEEEGAEVEAD